MAGKAGMVIKAKSCVICLHPNHTANQCYDRENQKRIYGVDGCKSHHHPTMHGAGRSETRKSSRGSGPPGC